ncbi:AAA family ATPase [Streptomyces sp. CA-181903]|uniref:AAA family ATPase n=1 Tax=Streptomyces sp. CA-181903 TaxID=3240055 RepID=UPI003D929673
MGPGGCLILSGLPGAGKSSVGREVAGRLERSALVSGDAVADMIVRGRVSVVRLPEPEARRQLLLRARNICSLAGNFADAGFTAVVDHVVPDREVLDLMVGLLRPRPVRFVVLAPPVAVCRARNAARPERERVDYDVAPLDRSMRQRLAGVGWWLDSAGMTVEETAGLILERADELGVVSGG